MKSLFLLIMVVFIANGYVFSQSSLGQKTKLEAEIRRLDLAEAKAFLEKHEKAIEGFFARTAVINNPRSSLTFGSSGVIDVMRSGVSDYQSFDRNIESVQLLGNTAIVMGNETVVLKTIATGGKKTVRRRYTNVWMKTGRTWQIVARHANVICE